MRRFAFGLLLAMTAAACSDSGTAPPAAPSLQTISIAGTWTGDVPVLGAIGRMTWTLSQPNATDVSGPVLIGLPTGTVFVNGFLTGTLSGSTLTYTISVGPGGIPLSPACVGQLGGTMTASVGSTATLSGDYAVRSSTCPAPIANGTVTLTRQ
jgi:hypothetical protein